ncbi:MAG TPA: M1 family aminopeptidase [Ktedonobacterales bacterium]|nr:M1 family aminopeptidase [Ktedonobacterales bacterium]
MYYCGYRDLARFIIGGENATEFLAPAVSDEHPAFALPGDRPVYAPDRPADVRHVDIVVKLDFASKSVAGTVTTHFTALFEEVREVTFDAAELVIERVTLTGADVTLAHWSEGEKLHVRLDRMYRHGEGFAIAIQYSAQPRIGLIFVEPSEGNPDHPVQAWTQGETEYHHFWFPCHDFPNDRATTSLSGTVPASFFLLSNGKMEEARENGDGTKTYRWRCEQPFPAYLITLVAGEFSEIADRWRDVPVNYYVRAGREEDGRRMFGKTPAMIEFFSSRFGVDYPYAKYGQVVSEWFLGAMENVSATTHSFRLLADKRASLDYTPEPVVAHELVHQWHGDMLAVRDWSHTWLKESFATYFEAAWTQHDRGEDEFRTELRQNLQNYLAADARGRRPIVYNVYRKNGNELFDRHVYEKGSLVLHMLRFVLGEESFWRGMQLYTRRNQWREVITADFERAMEEATGRSLARFFEQWVYKTGYPEFKVSYAWDDEHKLARLTVSQTQATSETTPVFATPVDIAFFIPDTEDAVADDTTTKATLTTFKVTVDEASQTFYFTLPRRPFSVRFDQGGWLIKTLDFERSSEQLRYQLRHDPDVLGRIEAAEALGKLQDLQSIEALERALSEEHFWSVRAAIAAAIASRKNERALIALLNAVEQTAGSNRTATLRLAEGELPEGAPADLNNALRARRALVGALGEFRAPAQAALAERAAATLGQIVTHGEPSYYVEAAAAAALGRTRTDGAFEKLVAKADTGSWNELVRGGVFAGLGELGDPRSATVLVSWLLDRAKPMDARAVAASGLRALAATRRIDPGETQTKVVEALIAALDDPWETAQVAVIGALAEWNDARAIPALRRYAERNPDERSARIAREAILKLQKGRTTSEEARTLRKDLDELRAENRTLRDKLEGLEARLEADKPVIDWRHEQTTHQR